MRVLFGGGMGAEGEGGRVAEEEEFGMIGGRRGRAMERWDPQASNM